MSKGQDILGTNGQSGASIRALGRYFTAGRSNPFALLPFKLWAKRAGLPQVRLLEPFAGRGDLLHKLASVGLLSSEQGVKAYDLTPAARFIKKRDTLLNFPKGFDVCVTNPPWLARNSASLRGLPFPPNCRHDDLYKHALELCLLHCGYVAALIPESFIRSFARFPLFYRRCEAFVSLTGDLFCDTAHPVGLAMFSPKPQDDIILYRNNIRLGGYRELQRCLPSPRTEKYVRFNDPCGGLGLFALDNTKEASIRFCHAEEVRGYEIGVTSRAITIINIHHEVTQRFINKINTVLDNFRNRTHDIFLTAYRGLRADGKYRRRLDWAQAKNIIALTLDYA